MIHNLKPYPAYKNSGVPWLGEVPEHWDVAPNRALLKLKKRLVGTSSCDYTLLSLTKQGIIARDLENPEGKFPASFDTYQKVEPNDLVFCLFDIDETPRTVGLSTLEGMITGAYTVFNCTNPAAAKFIYLFYLAMDNGKQLKPLYTGLRKVITKSTFLSANMPVPPLEEQYAIVHYLDYMDHRIRRYIHGKQKLIKLLEEQKQAIIHRAVTRGLDPDVKLKDSGVELLGDVPEHWVLTPIKQCAEKISKGTTPSTEGREILDDGPVRFLKAENIAGEKINDKPLNFIDEETNNVLKRSQLKEGDVLFVIAGATLGKIAVVNKAIVPANTNQAVAFIRPNKRVISNYLALWLQSPRLKELIWLNAVQSAQPNLSMANLGNFTICLPPAIEQKDIIRWVDNFVMKVNATIEKYYHEINLLKEYSTRLISDVVTGKLDVREVAANLPVEMEYMELSVEGEENADDGFGEISEDTCGDEL